MTTWGDSDDFRHFLPRVLELMAGDADSFDADLVLPKLAYGGWGSWPAGEKAAVEAFLMLRWNIGLTQAPRFSLDDEEPEFDAEPWLSGISGTGLDTAPFVDAWQRLGTTNTVGHIAAFLEQNPQLLSEGRLDSAVWANPDRGLECGEQLRKWLSGCMDNPEFREELAAWYQR